MRRWLTNTALSLALAACVAVSPATAQSEIPFPAGATGSYLAGQLAFQTLDTTDAARYFLEAARSEWDNPGLVESAFAALAADGQIAEAIPVAQRMLQIDPRNDLARLLLGTVALKERRFASALGHLQSVGTDSFISITGGIVRAWALVGQGDQEEAQRSLDVIAAAGLEDFLVFHRALMADLGDDRGGALSFARAAYETDPNVPRIVEAYVTLLANSGRLDEAKTVLAEFEGAGLRHPLIDDLAARIAAGPVTRPFAVDIQAGAAEAFYGIGTALARDGGADIAMIFMQLGLYLDPGNDILALALGQLLDGVGQFERANAVFAAIPDESPVHPEAMVLMAQNLEDLGDREGAITRLYEIVDAEPGNLDAISVLGDLLRFDERYTDATEIYTRALDLEPGDRTSDWRFYYLRGMAYERGGEWEQAEADFLHALQLNPEHPLVLNYLGYSWVDQGMHLQRALGMIETAVAAAPNDGYIVDSLGWAFYRLGRLDEAVEVLERAVRLIPTDPEINDHLGDAYWRVGREREARFQWRVAIDVDTAGNVTERATPKLIDGLPDVEVAEDSPG